MCHEHLVDLYAFYGEETGVKVARKHISWYTKGLEGSAAFRKMMNQLPDVTSQLAAVDDFFGGMGGHHDRLRYEAPSSQQELAA